jgi:Flp pilus assembly protein TadD
VVTIGWLAVNISAPRAARRMIMLQDPRGTFTNFARGYANETLGIYFRDIDVPAARDAYARATQANPSNARYFNNLGNLALMLEDVAGARTAFRRALELGLREWFVYHNLGLCELQLGDTVAADSLTRTLIQRWPGRSQGWEAHAQVCLNTGLPADALADLDRAVAIAPRDANLQYLRGEALRLLGRDSEARAAYERALQLEPRHTASRRALRSLPPPH